MENGQASLEFIMIYGWAILAVLVSMGALAYFGVLNPSIFLPSSCTLMPGLDCDEFRIEKSGARVTDTQVQLFIRNGLGDSIDFSALNVDLDSDGLSDCTDFDPAEIADGALSPQLNIDGCTIGVVGSRFRGDIIGTYTLSTSTLTHTMVGSIIVEVEA